ncbi:MAG: NUDIX hydrolase [Patescibacteria group bacterium]
MNNEIKPWTELSRRVEFEKFGRAMEKVGFKLPDGSVHDVYIKREGPAAGVVALTADKKVIITRQYRPGPKEILYDVPGGKINEGEDHHKVAVRELLEETGYRGDFQYIGPCYYEAYSTYIMYCYVATNCQKVAEIQEIADDFSENEKGFVQDIEVKLISVDEFRQILRSGMSTNVELGYMGLDYLGLL